MDADKKYDDRIQAIYVGFRAFARLPPTPPTAPRRAWVALCGEDGK